MHRTHTFLDVVTALVLLFSGLVFLYSIGRGGTNRRQFLQRYGERAATAGRTIRRLAVPAFRLTGPVLLGLIIGLPLAELGLRYYFDHYGTEQDRIRYVYSPEKTSTLDPFYAGEPYVGFGLSPDHPDHNSLGFRGPEIKLSKPLGVYRIVALGGSTTYGMGTIEYERTYPAQLERILRDEYGYENIEVINAGVPNYTSWETLVNLEFRVLDLDPDLIIYYGATNDITARIVYPEYYNGLYAARGLWQTGDECLGPSALIRFVAIKLGWMDDPVDLESKFVKSDIPQCDMWTEKQCGQYDIETLMELNPPIYFERNLRNIVAIAQTNGIDVMFSSWAYFPDTTAVTNIYTFPWRRKAVDEHNAIIRQIAEETGVAYYDLYHNLPYNRQYWTDDGYHQSPAGCEEQARQYARFIVSTGLLDSSVKQ